RRRGEQAGGGRDHGARRRLRGRARLRLLVRHRGAAAPVAGGHPLASGVVRGAAGGRVRRLEEGGRTNSGLGGRDMRDDEELPNRVIIPPDPDRSLALELVRATEAAAIASARWLGLGDKDRVDGAAVDAMRPVLGSVRMNGVVVIGEGEKDSAPMLFN